MQNSPFSLRLPVLLAVTSSQPRLPATLRSFMVFCAFGAVKQKCSHRLGGTSARADGATNWELTPPATHPTRKTIPIQIRDCDIRPNLSGLGGNLQCLRQRYRSAQAATPAPLIARRLDHVHSGSQ